MFIIPFPPEAVKGHLHYFCGERLVLSGISLFGPEPSLDLELMARLAWLRIHTPFQSAQVTIFSVAPVEETMFRLPDGTPIKVLNLEQYSMRHDSTPAERAYARVMETVYNSLMFGNTLERALGLALDDNDAEDYLDVDTCRDTLLQKLHRFVKTEEHRDSHDS